MNREQNRYERKRSRSRSRSRSPSPSSYSNNAKINTTNNNNNNNASRKKSKQATDRDLLDEQRRIRMQRLRAENEAEERNTLLVDDADYNESSMVYENDKYSQKIPSGKDCIIEVKEEDLEGLDEEEQMQRLMGFGNFDSSKGKAVEDNQISASKGTVSKNKARKYRQYMNRKGGFNRPLDKMN